MKRFFRRFKRLPLRPIMTFGVWFAAGILFGGIFILSSLYLGFKQFNEGKIYPGIHVSGVNFGGKTKDEVREFFTKKNVEFSDTVFTFYYEDVSSKISAEELQFGFDSNLLSEQAYTLGRSGNLFSDISIIFFTQSGGLDLSPSYTFSEEVLKKSLSDIEKKVTKEPVDALFTFQGGKVTTFKPSEDGKTVDWQEMFNSLKKRYTLLAAGRSYGTVDIPILVKVIHPAITTSQVNNFGIQELVGSGSSRFSGSIPNRIHNVSLAASKLNGILVKPGETFSFNKALGDVSKFTGYKEAYVIKDGRTVLGDGGGVCQVSTTLFRSILQSGLPILERHPHSYRVSYYEQDTQPGFDATVYDPSYDLKFKNDTEHYILIQSAMDPSLVTLRFDLYGTKDGREVFVSRATITNQTPPPPDLYQDDPVLPVGVVKQVDFKAGGAEAVFSREVKKNGEVIISESFRSRYRAWQAIFLRGTKQP